MIQLVQEAQERRPPAQLFIERFERGYAKVVVVGAIAVVALPSLAHWWTFREALYRSMILSRRCVSVRSRGGNDANASFGAVQRGAERSPLQRKHVHREPRARPRHRLRQDRHPYIGSPYRHGRDSISGETSDEILAAAASVENLSEHPLARAIVREAAQRNLATAVASDLQSVPGTGAHAIVGGERWSIGKASLFREVSDAAHARHRA